MEFLESIISSDYLHMIVRFMICLLTNWVVVDLLYYRKSRRRDFYFTFMLIGVAIFFIVFFMIFVLEDMKGKTGIGVGIGMFGIFSIMRYRTDAMPVREMTYLFVVICLSVVNALASTMPVVELILTDVLIVLCVWICERSISVTPSKLVQYDRIALIHQDRREELVADLKERTGLNVVRVEVGAIDFLRDMAVLRVYYNKDNVHPDSELNEKLKLSNDDLRKVGE